MRFSTGLACVLLFAARTFAQIPGEPQELTSPPPEQEPTPVLRWSFDEPVVGAWHGKPKIETTELRAPEFPRLSPTNKAAFFPGKNVWLRVAEKDSAANLRFDQGEAITIEAWVNPTALPDKAYAYLVGKGRTDNPGVAADNQNYALRLAGVKDEARVSFLFRSRKSADHESQYHRWTAKAGFPVGTGWHHVAISYVFGKPESIRAYSDGTPLNGMWDMGGATSQPPVVDGDDLLIGSAKNGAAGNTYHGWLDEVAIYRAILPEQMLSRHALHVPQTPIVNRAARPPGRVLVEVCERGVPTQNLWPGTPLAATETYEAETFGFFHVPHKYIDTGIRSDRMIPYLLRASADVEWPAGKHRLLLRGRGASRLYVDGKIVLTTPFPPRMDDGHNPIPTSYLDLGPDFRFAPPGNRETWTTFASPGKKHEVILETIVGGKRGNATLRPELGETVVALAPEGSPTFALVAPSTKVAYTDEGWKTFAERESMRLAGLESERRAAAWKAEAPAWSQRRAAAERWLASTPEVPIPHLPAGFMARNAIDHFLAEKISVARQESRNGAGKVDYLKEVKPILEGRCYSCHQGKKVKGGLRLDTMDGMVAGGDSEQPLYVRGEPAKSLLIERVTTSETDRLMPPRGDPLSANDIKTLERWIRDGAPGPIAAAAQLRITVPADDSAFLRRLSLDTVGVVPSYAEIVEFRADRRPDKRSKWIDRYLADPRWADNWVGYWQDVLAENPNILNPTLNNTGPYRWWIYEAFLDNRPMDVFATELVRMRGSHSLGGPAGFAMASENDVPMAEKGAIVASAFLAVQMRCARCHDAPAHKSMQKELFSLAAMLKTEAITVPKTSSVPKDKLHAGGRKSLIQVTLSPGTKVEPAWPFAEFVPEAALAELAPADAGTRERVAALLTAPQNERFAGVIVNRLWARLMGRGIVEPVDDWEKGEASHPGLLRYLGRELVRSGYDLKHVARLILNSHAYGRAVEPSLTEPSPYFAAPARRRLGAEQIVDSLFTAAGKRMDTEEVSLDVDGGRDVKNSISLGRPRRAWMFASTSNERDRPSLSLPRVQAVVDVLEAFGWRATRQSPQTSREIAPNVLQPAILANGTMSVWLTRLSDDHGVTALALEEGPLDSLVERLFQQVLTRSPRPEERSTLVNYLEEGFENRVKNPPATAPAKREPPKYVSWSNHLIPESSQIKMRLEEAARRGDTPTARLHPVWRQRLEDVLWALLNDPEFVFTP